ncbi:MAG: glycosyltransferase [Bacillota bacterium]
MNSRPLVSIGMPVYNGENLIEKALDTLIAQEYDNFELIICDNASIDNTADIIKKYSNKDNRIRYTRNQDNIGPLGNFKKVLELSQGEYFMWAAHDDMWHPSYIRELLLLLNQYDSAVLAVSQVAKIELSGELRYIRPLVRDSLGMPYIERLRYFLSNTYGALVYGLFRRHILMESASLMDRKDPMGTDVLIVLSCIDKGDLVTFPEPLFFERKHGFSSNVSTYQGLFKVLFCLFEYSRLLFKCFKWSDLPFFQKFCLFKACSLHIGRRLTGTYYRNLIYLQLRKKITKYIGQ